MKRYNIYLSELQIKNLDKIQKRDGLSKSELIRRALDFYLTDYFLPLDLKKDILYKIALCNDLEDLKWIESEIFDEMQDIDDSRELRDRLFDIVMTQKMKIMGRNPEDKKVKTGE